MIVMSAVCCGVRKSGRAVAAKGVRRSPRWRKWVCGIPSTADVRSSTGLGRIVQSYGFFFSSAFWPSSDISPNVTGQIRIH